MEDQPHHYPLIVRIVKTSRFPWYWVFLIITTILIVPLPLAAFLDGDLGSLLKLGFWRDFLDGPFLIIYILLMYPPVWSLWLRSAQVLKSLLPTEREDFNISKFEVPRPRRLREFIALSFGMVIWVVLWQPWNWSTRWETGAIWQSIYDVVTQTILYGFLGLLLYSSFSGNLYLNQLLRQRPNLNIFNTDALIPIARSGLGFSMAFIGGISLSLVFQEQEDLMMWNNILIWGILVCFAILIFFTSIWSTHRIILQAKTQELDMIKKYLTKYSQELKNQVEEGNLKKTEELSSTINVWLNYERRINEVPAWPYNTSIIRRLIASVFAPVLVFLIKIISGLGLRF